MTGSAEVAIGAAGLVSGAAEFTTGNIKLGYLSMSSAAGSIDKAIGRINVDNDNDVKAALMDLAKSMAFIFNRKDEAQSMYQDYIFVHTHNNSVLVPSGTTTADPRANIAPVTQGQNSPILS